MNKYDKLINDLSKFGNIEVMKVGVVVTLFITGKNLSKANNTFDVLGILSEYYKDEFPNIEVMKNDETYILIILKK